MDTFLGTPLSSLFFPDPQTQSRVPCVLQGPGQGRAGAWGRITGWPVPPGAQGPCVFPLPGHVVTPRVPESTPSHGGPG